MGCGASRDGHGLEQEGGDAVVVSPAASRPAGHVSQAAVSLAFLQRFAAEHRVRELRLTSEQLVAEVIKPATTAAATGDVTRRYADVMLRSGDAAAAGAVSAGRPFFFVSHVWSVCFADTVDMLSRHFAPQQQRVWRRRQGPPKGGVAESDGGNAKGEKAAATAPLKPLEPDEVFLWLDIFGINQHQGTEDDDCDLAALWEAVQDAAETLMVLDERGTPLSRIWCLFEAWQSLKAASGAEGGKLRLLSYGIPWGPLEKVFLDLDVSAARATVPVDRDRILEEIRRDTSMGGLAAMGHRLKDALVAGAVAQVPPAEEPWDEDRVAAPLLIAARLCKLYGRLPQAEALYRRLLAGCERGLGPEHEGTLAAVGGLAAVLQAQGRLGEAEALLRRDAEACARRLGPDAPGSLVATSNLAQLLMAQGRYTEAEPLLRRQLESSERRLGPSHPETLTAVNNLASLLQALGGRDADAEPLFRRAMEGQAAARGVEHVDALVAANNLACALQFQGKLREAEELHTTVLAAREKVLGPDHPDTLHSANNLGWVLQAAKKYDAAAELYGRALAGFERAVGGGGGGDAAAVFTCANNLGAALAATGRRAEAEAAYRRALAGQERVLGAVHPDTLLTMCNLAQLLRARGQGGEAEGLYRRALEGYEGALGAGHPDTGRARKGLAEVLEAAGRRAEAEAVRGQARG